jgi:hypothetical protein
VTMSCGEEIKDGEMMVVRKKERKAGKLFEN